MSGWFESATGFAKGFGKGVSTAAQSTWDGLKGIAETGKQLATDPVAREKAWEATKAAADAAKRYGDQVYDDPAKAYRDAKNGANRAYTEFDEARKAAAAKGESGEFWGNVVGQGAFEIGTALIPVGAASKAGKLGKAAKGLDAVGDVAGAAKKAKGVSGKAKAKPSTACAKPCPLEQSPAKVAKTKADDALALAAARRKTALDFFKNEMKVSEEEARKLLEGVDDRFLVEVVDIPPPETMSQYVRKSHGKPGNWFNPDTKQTADMVGLNGDPTVRELKTFKTPPGKALKSVAKPIVDDWTDKANAVATSGGGVQMTVSNAVRDAFMAVK